MGRLVNDLLDFGRSGAGQFRLQCRKVDLRVLVRQAVERGWPGPPERDILARGCPPGVRRGGPGPHRPGAGRARSETRDGCPARVDPRPGGYAPRWRAGRGDRPWRGIAPDDRRAPSSRSTAREQTGLHNPRGRSRAVAIVRQLVEGPTAVRWAWRATRSGQHDPRFNLPRRRPAARAGT